MQLFKLFILIMPLLAITACGIKPKNLTPPAKDTPQEQTFPRTYPDPALYH